jgi:hypothetical protein
MPASPVLPEVCAILAVKHRAHDRLHRFFLCPLFVAAQKPNGISIVLQHRSVDEANLAHTILKCEERMHVSVPFDYWTGSETTWTGAAV